jgi:hypothetical protein
VCALTVCAPNSWPNPKPDTESPMPCARARAPILMQPHPSFFAVRAHICVRARAGHHAAVYAHLRHTRGLQPGGACCRCCRGPGALSLPRRACARVFAHACMFFPWQVYLLACWQGGRTGRHAQYTKARLCVYKCVYVYMHTNTHTHTSIHMRS